MSITRPNEKAQAALRHLHLIRREGKKPPICIDGIQTDKLMEEALRALMDLDCLYVRGGAPVRFERNEHGNGIIRPLSTDALHAQLALAAAWFKQGGERYEYVDVEPPRSVA